MESNAIRRHVVIFSNWFQWVERKQLGTVLNYPGIYAICSSPNRNLHNEPFEWRENMIYIGMTNSVNGLKGRLKQFDNTMQGKTGHGGADRVRFKHQDYNEFISSAYVAVCYIECDVTSNRPVNLRKMGKVAENEYLAIAEYVERFNKLPEFNNKKESKKFSKHKKPIL